MCFGNSFLLQTLISWKNNCGDPLALVWGQLPLESICISPCHRHPRVALNSWPKVSLNHSAGIYSGCASLWRPVRECSGDIFSTYLCQCEVGNFPQVLWGKSKLGSFLAHSYSKGVVLVCLSLHWGGHTFVQHFLLDFSPSVAIDFNLLLPGLHGPWKPKLISTAFMTLIKRKLATVPRVPRVPTFCHSLTLVVLTILPAN